MSDDQIEFIEEIKPISLTLAIWAEDRLRSGLTLSEVKLMIVRVGQLVRL